MERARERQNLSPTEIEVFAESCGKRRKIASAGSKQDRRTKSR